MSDATFLIDFAHVKGHPSCGFGACIKNLALGGFVQATRAQIHDTNHYIPYWHKEKCPDEATRKKITRKAARSMGLSRTGTIPRNSTFIMRTAINANGALKVAPEGSLEIIAENFAAFQKACGMAVDIVLSTFKPEKRVFLSLATQMTPVCDCFGFTGLSILPDLGIFGSNDIVAH